jgi:hypothetical protein
VEAKPAVPIWPSNSPMTPSMIATSARRESVRRAQQRRYLLFATEIGIKIAPDPTSGQRVIAGIDVVRAQP